MHTSAKKQEGFTIIEMLIVSAIAGLILFFVLAALPMLQRSGRNNQRKQDVSAILQAVSSYALNNSGNFPDTSSPINISKYAKLTFYNPALVVYGSSPATGGIAINGTPAGQNHATETNSDRETVIILNHRKCNSSGNGSSTSDGAGFRDVVALYAIETGSGASGPKCLEL